jgi:hypothetical protein
MQVVSLVEHCILRSCTLEAEPPFFVPRFNLGMSIWEVPPPGVQDLSFILDPLGKDELCYALTSIKKVT